MVLHNASLFTKTCVVGDLIAPQRFFLFRFPWLFFIFLFLLHFF